MKLFLQNFTILFSLFSCCLTSPLSAQTFDIAYGGSSINLTTTASEVGTVYYVVSNNKADVLPTGSKVKTDAQSTYLGTASAYGSYKITSEDLNKPLLRSIAKLKYEFNLFVYVVFESKGGTFSAVTESAIKLPKRQISYSYISKDTPTLNKTIKYTLYKNDNYLKDRSNKKYPLIISFHGNMWDQTNVEMVRSSGLPNYIDNVGDVDFLVLAPLSYYDNPWFQGNWINILLEKIKKEERVDTNRIYVTGLSNGGGGVQYLSATQPHKIAAMLTTCATNSFDGMPKPYYRNYCLIKDIPLWAFHNQGDNTITVSNSESVVSSINACTPKPVVPAMLTIYPLSGHDSWTMTFKNIDVYKWFLGYTKKTPTNVPPVITTETALVKETSSPKLDLTVSAKGTGSKFTYFWYQISGPNVTLRNQETESLSLSDYKSGDYKFRVLVTDELGSTSFEDVDVKITVVTDLANQNTQLQHNVGLYPNPVENTLFLRTSQHTVSYSVLDLLGNTLKEGEGTQIDVSTLSKGTYVVKCNNLVQKFSKL